MQGPQSLMTHVHLLTFLAMLEARISENNALFSFFFCDLCLMNAQCLHKRCFIDKEHV